MKTFRARVAELGKALGEARSKAKKTQQTEVEARKTSSHSLKMMSQEVAKIRDKQPEGLLTEAGKRLKI